MLAIPLSNEASTVISDLYGNTPYFALLDTETGDYRIVENEVQGEGPKSADFLKSHGAQATIYYHMGEGVYKSFKQNDMSVYTVKNNYLTLDEIYLGFLDCQFCEVDESNYKELLDPGNAGACKCGCEN